MALPEEKQTSGESVPETPVKYATPVQRVWAWVGVVYMVIIILLTTYGLANGEFIQGIGGLMLSPALVGLGSTVILRHRQGEGRGGIVACVLISGAAFGLALWNLIHDVPILISQLRG